MMESSNRDYYHEMAAYWEVVAEDAAPGFALEQAQQQRRHYLMLLGIVALEGGNERTENTGHRP